MPRAEVERIEVVLLEDIKRNLDAIIRVHLQTIFLVPSNVAD
jgi:hypothetical protein